MGFLGRNRISAGLDIGSGLVKLVAMDHGKPEPEIINITIMPLIPDAIVEGEIMDPVLVVEALHDIIARSGVKPRHVVASVGGHDVIIKKIQMDRMSDTDARDVIRWEAQQHVPFDMESVQLDFQILDPQDEGIHMEVLLVAAKRELIENRMALLADAQLAPAVIDVDAFALYNAFEHSYPEAMQGLVAVVNVGHETTNLNILDDGVPALVRDIPFGSRRLRAALQRDKGLTAERAEELLQGKANGTDVGDLVAERIDELAVGIERAGAFIIAQNGGEGIGRVFLSGGGACVPGLQEALAQRLGIRTEKANPFERIGVRPEVMESIPVDELAPALMLPVGLALRHP